ncbi:hypothetical protein Bhyg_07996, partial [Pseudolycoriella hygida]
MADKDKKPFFKFNGPNFNNWKFRMEEKELTKYIEEDLEIITLHATDREYRAHMKKDIP